MLLCATDAGLVVWTQLPGHTVSDKVTSHGGTQHQSRPANRENGCVKCAIWLPNADVARRPLMIR